MYRPILSSTEAYETAEAIVDEMNQFATSARNPQLQGLPDGGIHMMIFIGDREILTVHINGQGKMTDLQSCSYSEGRVTSVSSEYKQSRWCQLVESGIPILA